MNNKTNSQSRLAQANMILKQAAIPALAVLLAVMLIINVVNAAKSATAVPATAPDISQTPDPYVSTSEAMQPVSDSSVLPEGQEQQKQQVQTPPPQRLDADISAALDGIAVQYGAVAVQLATIEHGAVSRVYCCGTTEPGGGSAITDHTMFRVASLSKLPVAMTVMKLCEEGKMSLDSDIGNYLGYPVRCPSYPDVPITPRMLMMHTSSVVDSQLFLESREGESSIPLRTLLEDEGSYSGSMPGSTYTYSNFAIAVLAAAAEKAAGCQFYRCAAEKLFEPLGIRTSFLASQISDKGAIVPLYDNTGAQTRSAGWILNESTCEELGQTHHIYQGNLISSAEEYARLLCLMINGGKTQSGEQLISNESIAAISDTKKLSDGVEQGLCLAASDSVISGRHMLCHTGSAYGIFSSFVYDAADSSGVVVITNGANAQKDESGLYDICADMIRVVYGQSIE